MKKFLVLLVIIVFAFSSTAIANDFWQNTIEARGNGPHGPHGPGDCVPNESPSGPYGK